MTFRIHFGERNAIDPLRRVPLSDLFARARLRREIEDDIERKLDLLELLNGDADAEDNGDAEPSLGWSRTMAHGTSDDREETEVGVERFP